MEKMKHFTRIFNFIKIARFYFSRYVMIHIVANLRSSSKTENRWFMRFKTIYFLRFIISWTSLSRSETNTKPLLWNNRVISPMFQAKNPLFHFKLTTHINTFFDGGSKINKFITLRFAYFPTYLFTTAICTTMALLHPLAFIRTYLALAHIPPSVPPPRRFSIFFSYNKSLKEA